VHQKQFLAGIVVCAPESNINILARAHSHAIKQRESNGIWEQCLLMIAVMRETRSRDRKTF
jgi:hypothetical protein